MKIAIMQPYFLPYIGYFQLINAVDKFVIYDNIKYTKKGWISRNRFLQNDKAVIFSIPLKKDSDYLCVNERKISDSFNKTKILNQLTSSYQKALYYDTVYPMIKEIITHQEVNLFKYILHSIQIICKFLEIKTDIIISSTIDIDHSLASQNKILAICNNIKSKTYINTSGGRNLYKKDDFTQNNICLKFIESRPIEYKQFSNIFVPWLSIIDIMMFNTKSKIKNMLNQYEII